MKSDDPQKKSARLYSGYSLTKAAARNSFSVSAATSGPFSLSVHPGKKTEAAPVRAPRPTAGPDIGPDPRNAEATVQLTSRPVFEAGGGVRYDFDHGFRIEMPPGNGRYRLKVCDLDTQTTLLEREAKGGELVTGERKYYIRYRFEVTDAASGRLIASHDFDCEGKKVMIVIPDGGLGDNLAWLPYVEAFREKRRARVTCVCGEWLIRLVRDQYPELDFHPVAQSPSTRDFYAVYFCAIFPKERKAWRPTDHQNLGMQGSIAEILGVEPVPRKLRLRLDSPRPFPEPFVCISAMATNPAKHWNYPDGWNVLCRYLKRQGYRVLVLDRDREQTFRGTRYRVPEEAEDFTGLKPISQRIDLLQHADFFVGLPSGLSWLAWNCGIPVVMISGFTLDGAEFPTPYRVTNHNFCHGCWNDSNSFFDMKAPVWCPRQLGTSREIECTRTITPKMVIDTIQRIPSFRKKLLPPVSFAIPVHDPPPDLFRLMLESVIRAAEAYGNAEILIQDDASEDRAVRFLEDDFQNRYPGLLFVERWDKNAGITASRRRLLARARGRYLMIFDSDDILLPFDLERIVRQMELHPDIVCSYGKKRFFDRTGPLLLRDGFPFSPFSSFFSMMQIQNGSLFRTSLLRDLRVYEDMPPGLEEKDDLVLFSRLAAAGRCVFEPEYRSLSFRHGSRPDRTRRDSFVQNVRRLTAPWPSLFADLEKGLFPENVPDDVPLAALAGAAFFLHQTEPGVASAILKQARTRFPLDPGLRQQFLLQAALSGSGTLFDREWTLAVQDFKENSEELFFVLTPAFGAAQNKRLDIEAKRRFLSPLLERERQTPGPVRDAWDSLLAKRPDSAAHGLRPLDPVRVSVIVPVFRAQHIRPCVRSIVRAFASYGRTEILLYNDASPEPGLDDVLNELQAEAPDMIRVFRGRENLGVASSRSRMVAHSRGDYIVSFDHDDLMLPFDVPSVLEFMDRHPEYSVSYAPKYLFNENGYMNQIHGSGFSRIEAFFSPKVNINAAFIRRKHLLDAGSFLRVHGDKSSGLDDAYLFLRLAQNSEIHFDPEARTLYRIHSRQISARTEPWDPWLTQTVCDHYPDLMDRILHGDIPDVHGPDFRIVRGLMGAALFFHQKERNITDPIIRTALREFPDDPGVPDLYLTLLRMDGNLPAILQYYPAALELFRSKNDLFTQMLIMDHVLAACRSAGKAPPQELVRDFPAVRRRYLKLSPLAERFMPHPQTKDLES